MLRRPRVLHGAGAAQAAGADTAPPRRIGSLCIDVAGREVFLDEQPIILTRTEFDILDVLSARPGVVLSRRQLLETIRDGPWVGNDHLVDVHIGHLRRKLGDDATAQRFIVTVRGVGYRMGTGQ
jgi:DNA-binding response OmpR family regulator